MLTVYLSALLATVAAQAAPGPNFIAVTRVALAAGRSRAVLVAAGVACGVLLWVSAFAFGMSALLDAYPILTTAMKLIGGAYFIYIAIRAFLAACRTPLDAPPSGLAVASRLAAWRLGFLVVLTNPKAALMWAAVTGFLSAGGLGTLEVMLFAPVGAMSAFLIYGGYGVLFSTVAAQRAYRRIGRVLDGIFGAVFGALGVRFLIDGARELRH